MSLLDFVASFTLGATPAELSAIQKAVKPKHKRKDCVNAESSSSSVDPQASASNPSSSTREGDQPANRNTKEAESGPETYRSEDSAVEPDEELPVYSETSGDLPAYSRGSR